jgi:hypothetical protein
MYSPPSMGIVLYEIQVCYPADSLSTSSILYENFLIDMTKLTY